MSAPVPMEGVELDAADASTFTNVLYKKQEGSLTCSSTHLTFRPAVDQAENSASSAAAGLTTLEWKNVAKHQVSPVTYPKAMLKIIFIANDSSKSKSITFQMSNRSELERIRKDITTRLQTVKAAGNSVGNNSSKKRPHGELSTAATTTTTSFGTMDPTAVAVTRSALLAANAALRQQHKYLVTDENSTVSEDDFWKTHQHLLEEEYARISGLAKAGTSSELQSHLPSSGRVTLGVQEMRQIFILYPAVHKAYEEKVPLELSDEQFWRKYLESEYFHRDRGRLGTAARNHAPAAAAGNKTKGAASGGPTFEQQEARAAAVGADDLFSRYDQKLQEEQSSSSDHPQQPGDAARSRKWGRNLAVGQFDLASTFETERGELLEGPRDNHPLNNVSDGGKGSRVISKYNRHWAMVLHPDEAMAGSNLMEVARRSVRDVLPNDPDAKAHGGVDEEMRRLVAFADAPEEEANHATGVGLQHGGEGSELQGAHYEPLTLQHVEAYYTGQANNNKSGQPQSAEAKEEAAKKHTMAARSMAETMERLVKKLPQQERLPETCFPVPEFGCSLLTALTNKMATDSQTEAQSLEIVNQLPEEFRDRLQADFRRSSELLRHFFGLRRLAEAEAAALDHSHNGSSSQKLARIVGGMETLFLEMGNYLNGLPQSEKSLLMRKMYKPIMDQLDWAFKLKKEGSGGRGGGFVTV